MKTFKSFASEIQVTYVKSAEVNKIKVTQSIDVYNFIKDLFPVDLSHREAFMAVYLNRANNTIGFSTISIGGVSATIADGKIIFQEALKCNASGIILVHNHPSGNLNPSQSDLDLTKRFKEFGQFIDLIVMDHLIIGPDDTYHSMADNLEL